MNKTVTINISGIIFHIEEDAYDSLSKYLSTIKGYFSKTDGGNEIMSDIEARIAELLQSRINAVKQVILMADVEHVMDIMGKPEEFGAEPASGSNKGAGEEEPSQQYTHEKVKRRLFRNPDEKAIGGVCSGLAAYFDIDTVWVRLAMFLLIFFGGISIWVYIILWLVIPQAKTTADKFAMRGEPANVNTIFKSFKEEAEDVKNRFDKYGRDFKSGGYAESVRSNLSSGLRLIFNIIARLIGLVLLFIGGAMLIGLVVSPLGLSIADGDNGFDLSNWKRVVFESPADYALGVLAFILVVGIPVLMLIYTGIKLLFRISYSNRWLNLSLGILWLAGLALGIYVTANTLGNYSESSRVKETLELSNTGDTIVIKLNPSLEALKAMKFDNEDEIENHLNRRNDDYFLAESGKALSVIGRARLSVVESPNDSVEMVISRIAKGATKKEANENAKAIQYTYHQNSNELVFDPVFITPADSHFGAQELSVKLKLPKGKVIFFDSSVKHLLNDVENTSNTWDGDMVNRRWKMTAKGLECIDCENLENADGSHHRYRGIKTDKITINDEGIHVKGSETEIKIDDHGIRIKTPEQNVEVNDEKDSDNKD